MLPQTAIFKPRFFIQLQKVCEAGVFERLIVFAKNGGIAPGSVFQAFQLDIIEAVIADRFGCLGFLQFAEQVADFLKKLAG